jgi:hypothetical protein
MRGFTNRERALMLQQFITQEEAQEIFAFLSTRGDPDGPRVWPAPPDAPLIEQRNGAYLSKLLAWDSMLRGDMP